MPLKSQWFVTSCHHSWAWFSSMSFHYGTQVERKASLWNISNFKFSPLEKHVNSTHLSLATPDNVAKPDINLVEKYDPLSKKQEKKWK